MWHNLSQRECVGAALTSAEVRRRALGVGEVYELFDNREQREREGGQRETKTDKERDGERETEF